MAPILRVGLIGLGMMGRHHARVLQSLSGIELVAVADPAGDPYQAAKGFRVHRSVEDVIATGIDMCVVATPTSTHEGTAMALADAGVHALIEKPVASDSVTGSKMAAAFTDAGLIGCVGHIERYNPAVQSLRARLAAGELGRVYQVATRRQGPYPTRVGDIGVVMDLATHDLDLTAWTTGSSYAEVSARVTHTSGRGHEDLIAALGWLSDGTVTNHLVNWLSPLKERVTVVTGERGCFVANTLTADLTFHANGVAPVGWDTMAAFRGVVEGDMIRYALAKPEPLVTELSAFRDAVLGLSNDIVPLQDAVQAVSVAEAALRSAREGGTVSPEGAALLPISV